MNCLVRRGLGLRAFLLVTILSVSTAVVAGDFLQRWFQNRLFAPNEQQRELERKGQVVIYDGLYDTEVNRAMETQFERIEYMMFVGTIITDENGEPEHDTNTGELMKEDDDC